MACFDPKPEPTFTSLGVNEFCEWIEQCDHEFPEAVVDGLRENGVNGSLFLQLSTEELKELAPRIADRVVLRQIQSAVRIMYDSRKGSLTM